jgi:hypothetical protein
MIQKYLSLFEHFYGPKNTGAKTNVKLPILNKLFNAGTGTKMALPENILLESLLFGFI